MEQIKLFIEKVKTDEELQAQMKTLYEDKSDVSRVLEIAKESGFDFSEAEWKSFTKEMVENHRDKLDDDQLASVAGGWVFSTSDWILCSIIFVGIMCAANAINSKISQGTASDCEIDIDL